MNENRIDSQGNRVYLRSRVVVLEKKHGTHIKVGAIGYVRSMRSSTEYPDGSSSVEVLVSPSMDIDLPDADWIDSKSVTVIGNEESAHAK